ncbi:MAG: indolepyruvate ferredoxin oxidoreductase subunit alpha [Candidatus Altiarchaeia archaeon]
MSARKLLLGNEAIAEAVLASGAGVAAAYPGTPSTEIMEHLSSVSHGNFHAEWSVNEKVALETCAGASYSGVRSLCAMKHVGLNVAMDPFMTLAYTGITGGLLLIVADDPGMHSSQNEQDSRHLVGAAKLMCFEPASSQEAHDMVLEAYALSEKLELPMVMRTMTRVAHTATPVVLKEHKSHTPTTFIKNSQKYVMVPAFAKQRHKWLLEKQKEIAEYVEASSFNSLEMKGNEETGIVACGSAYNLAREFSKGCAILKCGTWPIPEKKLALLASKVKRIIVLEEGDPIVEKMVRCMHKNVRGKLTGDLPLDGELLPEYAMKALNVPEKHLRKIGVHLPPRPPMLCPGCPHRATYHVLKQKGRDVVCGDIGCYTLGVQKPLGVLDTCLCMGASINKAAGMYYAGNKKVYAVIGESTFIHSGITGLMNSVYNGTEFILVIFDNHNTAMTGHQPTPLTGLRADGSIGKAMNLEKICEACGVEYVRRYDPKNLADVKDAFREAEEKTGVRVLIADSPCIMYKNAPRGPPHAVDRGKCIKCKACLQLGCPAIMEETDGSITIKEIMCTGCALCAQVCPKKAIRAKEKK